jgi:hypothetical protein
VTVSGAGEARLPEPGAFDAHTHLDIMGLPVDGILAAARAPDPRGGGGGGGTRNERTRAPRAGGGGGGPMARSAACAMPPGSGAW